MAKFWDVARWFVDPVGSLAYTLSKPDDNGNNVIDNVFTGVWNDYTGNTANRENIAYQKEYNEQVFNRADTQYQRTVADLRQSGLSAQLAAGAPSTVAGASAAPQRTVGDESEAINNLVGMVNSIRKTSADVVLSNAQADQAKSAAAYDQIKTSLAQKDFESYDERNAAELASKRASAQYHVALTELAQKEGQTYTARVQSKLENEAADTAYKWKTIEVAQSQIDLAYSNIDYNSAKGAESYAHRDYLRQSVENLRQEKANLAQDLVNKVKQGVKMDKETELLVKQIAMAQVESDIAIYNFDYSMGNNLRTTDGLPTLFGTAPNWIGSTLGKMNNTVYSEWKSRFEDSLNEFHAKNAAKKASKRDPYTVSEILQMINDWNNKLTPINWLMK